MNAQALALAAEVAKGLIQLAAYWARRAQMTQEEADAEFKKQLALLEENDPANLPDV